MRKNEYFKSVERRESLNRESGFSILIFFGETDFKNLNFHFIQILKALCLYNNHVSIFFMGEFQFLLLKNCKKQQCVGVSKRGTSIWELQVGNGKIN